MTWTPQQKSKKQEEVKVLTEEIKYKTIDLKNKFGLNLAIIGQHTRGKSTLAGTFGFFNSKYVNKLDPEKFPNTIKLLKGGYMPEVEKVQILDLDNGYEKASSRGSFKNIMKPLFEDDIVEIKALYIPERQENIEDGEVFDSNIKELEKAKREIETYIKYACKHNGPEVLFIIDSMSSYEEVLNNRFKILFEKVANLPSLASTIDMKKLNQAFWTIRNGWWNEIMKTKRGYPGWQIDIYKATATLDWVKETQKKEGKPVTQYHIQWGSPNNAPLFNLDQVYFLHRDVDDLPYVDLKEGRYKSQNKADNHNIRYELKKRNAGLILIEHMAPYLMEEIESDDEMW